MKPLLCLIATAWLLKAALFLAKLSGKLWLPFLRIISIVIIKKSLSKWFWAKLLRSSIKELSSEQLDENINNSGNYENKLKVK